MTLRRFFLLQVCLCVLFTMSAYAQVVINEISYNPPESGNDSLEYIELYNAGGSAVNLDGWHFTKGVVDTFPSIMLGAGEYYVTAINADAINHVFGVNVRQWKSGALSNSGETITLVDAGGNLIDSVAFRDVDPWPTEPDGSGPSLELKDAATDNNDGVNWQSSGAGTGIIINGFEVSGTPGAENSSGSTGGPAVTIDLANNHFTPQHAVVKIGDLVRWVNNDLVLHNVDGQQSIFHDNPADIYSGVPAVGPWQFDFTPAIAGLYRYQCDVHALSGMVGTLGVYDPLTYTDFDLQILRLTDGTNGQHIYVGVPTTVTGVVHGINFLPTGYSFYIIQPDNTGINVFSATPGSYTVQEGDLIKVSGVIDQFNGLLEIIPDAIEVINTNQPLVSETEIQVPDEASESSHVYVLFAVDSIIDTGTSGRNVYGKNSNGDPVLVRVDADSDIYNNIPEPNSGLFGVEGVGTQFDANFPYTGGYQVLAFSFFPLPGFPLLDANAISMKPNPANEVLNFQSDLIINRVELYSLDGKVVITQSLNAETGSLNVDELATGMYIIKAITDHGIWTSKALISK